jgi:hypothetical protein
LKHKHLPGRSVRLPSLEWLQKANSRAIVVATLMLAAGVVSGMILNRINFANNATPLSWNDPVILSTLLLLVWLLAAVVVGAFYRPARRGRKVAYLTLVSFVFLVVMLVAGLLLNSRHWEREERGRGAGDAEEWSVVSGQWSENESSRRCQESFNRDPTGSGESASSFRGSFFAIPRPLCAVPDPSPLAARPPLSSGGRPC